MTNATKQPTLIHLSANNELKRNLLFSAYRVRIALQAMHSTVSLLQGFPRGACEFSTILLGRFVLERFGYHAVILSSKICVDKNTYSHAWLNYSLWHVDITADQFDYPPVICASTHFGLGPKCVISVRAHEFASIVDNGPDLFVAWQKIRGL